MSIRNKRLKKELTHLNKYNLILANNWEYTDIIQITRMFMNTQFTIHINKNYPFNFPKIYIYMNNTNIDYIEWYLNTKNNYNLLKNNFNIKLKCICCTSITCNWAPTMTLSNLLDE